MYGQLYVETIFLVGLAILVCVGAVWFAARVATRVVDGVVDVLRAFIFSTIIVNRVPLALKWRVSPGARHHLTDRRFSDKSSRRLPMGCCVLGVVVVQLSVVYSAYHGSDNEAHDKSNKNGRKQSYYQSLSRKRFSMPFLSPKTVVMVQWWLGQHVFSVGRRLVSWTGREALGQRGIARCVMMCRHANLGIRTQSGARYCWRRGC